MPHSQQPSIPNRLKDQVGKQPPVIKVDLTGKTICVLGANTGIGFQTCKHFATMNPGRIILACRSEAKGREAVQRLSTETGYTKGELWIIDLANFESVKRFATQFEQDGGRLDILICNAAIEPGKYVSTQDGWESTLQVNYISTSFAALLLLPTLLRTANDYRTVSRLVFVSSELHYDVIIEEDARANRGSILRTLSNEKYLKKASRMRQQYSVTKLLNVFFARALTAQLSPSAPVVVNAVAPGFTVSELRRDLAGAFGAMVKVLEKLLAISAEEASRRYIWAAVGPADTRGLYINRCEVKPASDFVIRGDGPKVQQDVWVETMTVLARLDPRINATAERYLSS
ncbi:hypothetical protein C8F04DRAFT_975104 [Mycena alexandri]|uniref:NAD(P)-binding protein n=1 Tax=Mycena alexandri TaxID=1745969 RepID=A0AAD6S3Y8_9AGAR|nr:hypothetical protein C8F04DRAFT_975104 [Mycena alexandri]